ncbi:hypothetical protein RhiirA1_141854 [Rhizophagus irregularis]|uniref:Uncharacterized protein n=1 Tax=Rhizophagus irregularis TaxID=588596 RepID=A0A2I1FA71_9GLOM|nr:hypothetical protein RhiirA1_141854 [Rhizophagus irregularis]PKY31266.1 hypothetical protein RhiirB3_88179 [Rhizophagus irregularis]GET56305.1 hypothetical protein RIR_jg36886.t1 [Rhizophagus irregularis DAOM 181602=DAOM 197198]
MGLFYKVRWRFYTNARDNTSFSLPVLIIPSLTLIRFHLSQSSFWIKQKRTSVQDMQYWKVNLFQPLTNFSEVLEKFVSSEPVFL